MSADNRICVMRNEHGEWAVWHGSASMDYYEPPALSESCPSKEQAIAVAQDYATQIGYVECGVQFIGVDEQKIALINTICDLAQRLARLQDVGAQWKSRHEDNDD